jgi:hypothetical protein
MINPGSAAQSFVDKFAEEYPKSDGRTVVMIAAADK